MPQAAAAPPNTERPKWSHEIDLTEWGLHLDGPCELHDEIDRLPEKYRQPIILCYLQGLSQTQAAPTLGWPLGTVQTPSSSWSANDCDRTLNRPDAGRTLRARSGDGSRHDARFVPTRGTETTAHAAVQFAAGKGTAGLGVIAGVTRDGRDSARGHARRLLMLGGLALRRCCRCLGLGAIWL